MESVGYTLYMHISPSGKKYVGITTQLVAKRWGKNGEGYLQRKTNGEYRQPSMAHAILKYPDWQLWEHKILQTGLNKEAADAKEKKIIEELNLRNPKYGYNIKEGGGNGKPSEETRRKQSEAHKGKRLTETQKIKIGNSNKGRQFSEETRCKISKALKGRKFSEERKEKLKGSHSQCQVICIETKIVYLGVNEAARKTGINRVSIGYACKGKQKTAGGYHWEYIAG